MKVAKYVKNKIIFFLITFLIIYVVGTSFKPKASSHENAYLACFVDDISNTYKYQVIFSGEDVEFAHIIAPFSSNTVNVEDDNVRSAFEQKLKIDEENVGEEGYRVGLINYKVDIDKNFRYDCRLDGAELDINNTNGAISVRVANSKHGMSSYRPGDIEFKKIKDGGEENLRPMTFPGNGTNASTADINRAYDVQELLCNDFNRALLFINDGLSYDSLTELESAGLILASAGQGTIITNKQGNQYRVDLKPFEAGDYANYLYITPLSYYNKKGIGGSVKGVDEKNVFCWRIKKGYNNCLHGSIMESGIVNRLISNEYDTTYLTWEHIYLEAGILEAEGITYANQADLFSLSSFEESIVELTRNLTNGIRGWLQMYRMEDCIFNQGVRNSKLFVYGTYYSSWSSAITGTYLVFVLIYTLLVMLALIVMAIRRQAAIFNPSARAELFDNIRAIIVSSFLIASVFPLFKFLLIINFKWVEIWGSYAGGKSLADTNVGYSLLSAVLIQIAYLAITFYVNFVYIMRSIIIPSLFASSPLFIGCSMFGIKGKKITGLWLKEILGLICIQSIHAFVYGFILGNCGTLRGIEALVLCGCIIPATTIYKNITGIGADGVLKSAGGLAALGVGAVGAGVGIAAKTVGNVAGSAATAVGTAVGGPVGAAVGKTVGGVFKGAGSVTSGVVSIGTGIGGTVGLTGENSSNTTMVSSGSTEVGFGVAGMSRGFESGVSEFNKSTNTLYQKPRFEGVSRSYLTDALDRKKAEVQDSGKKTTSSTEQLG